MKLPKLWSPILCRLLLNKATFLFTGKIQELYPACTEVTIYEYFYGGRIMNPLTEELITGTTGELLVQLRLFQYGVQAAPPLKDSGNDLIAVRGHTLKAIQIKATRKTETSWQAPRDRLYHVLALVRLEGHDNELLLDESEVYLISRV